MGKYYWLIMLLLLCGCGHHEYKKHCYGKFISVTPISTSFNEPERSKVVTDRGEYLLKGYPSGTYGEEFCQEEVIYVKN